MDWFDGREWIGNKGGRKMLRVAMNEESDIVTTEKRMRRGFSLRGMLCMMEVRLLDAMVQCLTCA